MFTRIRSVEHWWFGAVHLNGNLARFNLGLLDTRKEGGVVRITPNGASMKPSATSMAPVMARTPSCCHSICDKDGNAFSDTRFATLVNVAHSASR